MYDDYIGYDMGWRLKLVKALDIHANDTILDIATGTADIPILIANQSTELSSHIHDPSDSILGPIIGLDPSMEMLNIGQRKIQKLHYQHAIQLVHGDVQNMSHFESDYFSKISMSFGLRNVENRTRGLVEIFRIFKSSVPTGHSLSKFCILEFSRPSSGYLSQLAILFIQYALPTIGTLLTGNYKAYKHLSDSILEFPLPNQLIDELHGIGFVNCEFENIFQDIVYLYTCSGEFDKINTENESKNDDYEFIAQTELNLNGL